MDVCCYLGNRNISLILLLRGEVGGGENKKEEEEEGRERTC